MYMSYHLPTTRSSQLITYSLPLPICYKTFLFIKDTHLFRFTSPLPDLPKPQHFQHFRSLLWSDPQRLPRYYLLETVFSCVT